MSLKSKAELKRAIFYAKEDPSLLFDILFDKVKDTPVATSVFIVGDTELTLSATESVTTKAPEVSVFDQYGDAIADPTVSYAIKSAISGCSVSSTTGVLTATTAVEAGSKPVIVATSGTKTAELVVTILAVPEETEE